MSAPLSPSPDSRVHRAEVARSPLVDAPPSGAVRIRLVATVPEDADPCVVLHRGRTTRVLLAEITAGGPEPLMRFAWKLRDDAALAALGDDSPTNAELDAAWQRERDAVARVRSPHVVAAIAAPPGMLRSGPVFRCRVRNLCFEPVCPTTGERLVECRDDAVRLAAGLTVHANDRRRRLRASDASGAATLYAIDGGEAFGPEALARGWLALAARRTDDPARDVAQQNGLPCVDCPQLPQCAAEPTAAAERLHPVSFGDVDAVALELAEVDFATALERLAGRPGRLGPRREALRRAALDSLDRRLSAFVDICRGVVAVHGLGRPYLALMPGNVVARRQGEDALRFQLLDLGSAQPLPAAEGDELLQPGAELHDREARLFLAPPLRHGSGQTVTMRVQCRLAAERGGGGRSVQRLCIDVPRAGLPQFVLPGDLLVVQAVEDGATETARVAEVSSRGLSAVFPADAAERRGAWHRAPFDARLSFARNLHPNADLHGLGMLMLHLLLVHPEQDFVGLAEAAEACARRLAEDPAVRTGQTAPTTEWQRQLHGGDQRERFAPVHLLATAEDRRQAAVCASAGNPVVPDVLWHAVTSLAGRLLLASPAAGDDEAPGTDSPVALVLRELADLQRLLWIERFDAAHRDGLLAATIARELQKARLELELDSAPRTTISAADLPEPGGGFVLAIQRTGDAGVEERHFTGNRVTLGRRENENDLHLNDPMVSSLHAVIERDGDEWVVFDRGSTNGTEVDGLRLPIEVPQPLVDGTEIHIRPFRLVFRQVADAAAAPTAMTPVDVDELRSRLCVAYARCAEGEEGLIDVALGEVLARARERLGRRRLVGGLEELERRLIAARGGDAAEPQRVQQQAAGDAVLRTLQQLSRALCGSDAGSDAGKATMFLARLQRFVEATSAFVERMLELRRTLGRHLDLAGTSTASARLPLRSAGDVQRDTLGPSGDGDDFLHRFFRDVTAIVEGLLLGNQQMRRAVRERLDPERLQAAVGKEARLGLLVQAAAGSALWKAYVQAWREVTTPDERDAEIDRLLAQATERRGSGR